MRFLIKVSMPHEPFNSYVKDGTAGAKMGKIMGELKPEAAYFLDMDGVRTGILIVNMDSTSQIPAIAEPWFLLFEADVEIHPAMLPDDLVKANLEGLGKKCG